MVTRQQLTNSLSKFITKIIEEKLSYYTTNVVDKRISYYIDSDGNGNPDWDDNLHTALTNTWDTYNE